VSPMEALLLGLVQGLTEFFPVSSSGHLAMIQAVLGIREEGGLVFEIAVHAATLIAIVIFYRRRIAALVSGALRGQAEALVYGAKLAVGTLPAVLVGLTAQDAVAEAFDSPELVALCLLITGSLLLTTRWTTGRARRQTPSFAMALAIGCAQAFAILPGISRSGTTVAVALALGLAPAAAAEFSFLLGVIAIADRWSEHDPFVVAMVAAGAVLLTQAAVFLVLFGVHALRRARRQNGWSSFR